MTLHLLKHPLNPVALACLTTSPPDSAAVILSDTVTLPTLSVPVYQIQHSSDTTGTNAGISFNKLVELIFAADKVITW